MKSLEENCSIPGYEFIRRAIVIYKVEEKISKEELIISLKEEGIVIPANKDLNFQNKSERDELEQWMIEAIKSIGIDIDLMEYIKQLSSEIGP